MQCTKQLLSLRPPVGAYEPDRDHRPDGEARIGLGPSGNLAPYLNRPRRVREHTECGERSAACAWILRKAEYLQNPVKRPVIRPPLCRLGGNDERVQGGNGGTSVSNGQLNESGSDGIDPCSG